MSDTQRCRDCVHWRFCSWFICSLTGEETECDFYPSKFQQAETKPPPPQESPAPRAKRPA